MHWIARMVGTLDRKLHMYTKFHYHIILFVLVPTSIKFWLVDSKLLVSKLFNQWFKSTEGIIWFVNCQLGMLINLTPIVLFLRIAYLMEKNWQYFSSTCFYINRSFFIIMICPYVIRSNYQLFYADYFPKRSFSLNLLPVLPSLYSKWRTLFVMLVMACWF